MGWKSVKEHYRIEHSVHVTDAGICVGSPYISNIIVINFDGVVVKRYAERCNDDLRRYQAEFDADPAKLRELVKAEDVFSKSITVFTYDDENIIEEQCEALGFPNTTHKGKMMYANSYSTDKSVVIRWAKNNAEYARKSAAENLLAAQDRLKVCTDRLTHVEFVRSQLAAGYPDIPADVIPEI